MDSETEGLARLLLIGCTTMNEMNAPRADSRILLLFTYNYGILKIRRRRATAGVNARLSKNLANETNSLSIT